MSSVPSIVSVDGVSGVGDDGHQTMGIRAKLSRASRLTLDRSRCQDGARLEPFSQTGNNASESSGSQCGRTRHSRNGLGLRKSPKKPASSIRRSAIVARRAIS